jgi:imidazolonepropionase-like amidohydrolase
VFIPPELSGKEFPALVFHFPNPAASTRLRALSLLLAVALVLPLFSAPLAARATATQNPGAPNVYAITNARIVPVVGPTLAKGTIVLRDGLIEAIGPNVAVPADATRIDGAGLTVYPGLIDALTRLGMPEAADYPAARGDAYPVSTVRAENSAASLLLRPDAAGAEARRSQGFVAALAVPQVGILPGTSAVVSLGDATTDPSALVLRADVAAHLAFGNANTAGGYPSSLMGRVAVARQAMLDAQDGALRLADYEKDPRGKQRPNSNRAVVALRPVVEKQRPLVVAAGSSHEMLRALRLAREFGLRSVINGGAEAYRVPAELKAAGASVILSADLPEVPQRPAAGEDDPSTLQGLRRRALVPTSASALHRAGVPFAFSTEGMARPGDFRANVRKMIARGLPANAAIEAATINAARMLGVDRQLGSLEPGKIASIVVTDGDLFGERTRIRHLFVDGKKMDLPATTPARTARSAASQGESADEGDEDAPDAPATVRRQGQRRAEARERLANPEPPSNAPQAPLGREPARPNGHHRRRAPQPTRTPT